jgi:hypothetical protein
MSVNSRGINNIKKKAGELQDEKKGGGIRASRRECRV